MNTIAKTKAEIQRDYSKRSNYAAQYKYEKDNAKRYTFKFIKSTEGDLIDHLEAQKNKAGYIKDLIRADIAKSKK